MQDWVNWFRQASPYISAHRHSTMVVGISGESIQSDRIEGIVHDLTLMSNLGIRLVLVVGARPQITQQIEASGLSSNYHKGLRITCEEDVEPLLRAVGEVRLKLEGLFSSGIEGSPMQYARNRLLSGNMVMAKPFGVIDGVDFQRTGLVRSVDTEAISTALKLNTIVMIPTLGYSVTGDIYNLGFEQLASEIAQRIAAKKLIFLSEERFHDMKGQAITQMSPAGLQKLLLNGSSLPESARRQCEAAQSASHGGINRIHLLNSDTEGVLLQELFTLDGAGVLINSDDYETLRDARVDDVAGVLGLVKPLEQAGILVDRSEERIENEIHQYIVDELDGAIIGCAALYEYGNDSGELACLAVNNDYRASGRGDLLLQAIIEKAESLNLSKLYVLTTQTGQWFEERGFSATGVESLPEERRSAYDRARNSKVFVKHL